jgi:hypothetical protein
LAGSESIVERFWLIIRETQQGYMGLVPAHAAAGDVVSILQGGAFPYVLRPSDDHFILLARHMSMASRTLYQMCKKEFLSRSKLISDKK